MNQNLSSPNPAGPAPQSGTDYTKPVAFDTQGRPLYLRPELQTAGAAVVAAATGGANQEATAATETGQWAPAFTPESHGNHHYVHVSRPIAPDKPQIPEKILELSAESRRQHPHLNLSEGEFIILSLKRHPIGLFNIWAGALLAVTALGGVMAAFIGGRDDADSLILLAAAGLALISFFAIGIALIATYIYNANRFYLTNESVIQEIQVGLFNKHEQTVSLANIEDASYYQHGLFPYFFNYGLIRLSTEGDETTYRFSYVSNPKKSIAILNNAVEAFKNGRPVEVTNQD